MAIGDAPSGFSLEASLAIRASPYCLRTDSMVRPASYGRSDSIYGGTRGTVYILRSAMMERMNWNDAAEDFLNQVLAQTPRPVRDATEAELRGSAEAMAEADGKNRVGVETVIAAWVRNTPETLRADLPRQMERFGLDPDEYKHLL